MRAGLGVSSCSTASAIRGRWAKVAASTQNQAKAALLLLYREVLQIHLPWLDNNKGEVPRGQTIEPFAHPIYR